MDFAFLRKDHFDSIPIGYDDIWICNANDSIDVLKDNNLDTENNSWSSEVEEIHEEPTKNGWIDVYERERVIDTAKMFLVNQNKIVVEFGASEGYMIAEMRDAFQSNHYIATDLMADGLKQSYSRNPDIMHIQCDFTDAPFEDESVDFIYSLNVLEHIEDDARTIKECYRTLRHGGYCLFVVPRGEKLYDYFDEMLYHKRRYASGELKKKCIYAGFEIRESFHYAWLCYPLFWIKKKWNRFVGRRLSRKDKIERVKRDIDTGMASPLAIGMMYIERQLSNLYSPPFGVREFILCKKN